MKRRVKCPKCGHEFEIDDPEAQPEIKTPPDPIYRYKWRGDKQEIIYINQEELKLKHPDACDPGRHEWHTTWQFGVYDCWKCLARREVK